MILATPSSDTHREVPVDLTEHGAPRMPGLGVARQNEPHNQRTDRLRQVWRALCVGTPFAAHARDGRHAEPK